MGALSLKIKTKKGQHILTDLTDTETIGSLKEKISKLTLIPIELINILVGYPPHPLDVSENDATLSNTKITNGDLLIIDEKPAVAAKVQQQQESKVKIENLPSKLNEQQPQPQPLESGVHPQGILLKKVVPSDNSCLFTSIGKLIIES